MRILFTTRGSAGHAGPLAPYAHAAARAGHEVLVATQPRHAANIERLGLPHVGLADPPESAVGPLMGRLPELSFDEANRLMLGEFFGRIDTEAALAPLRALAARWRPDLIVREAWEYASTIVGAERGIPVVRVALGLVELEERTIEMVAPALDRIRTRSGLQPDPYGDALRAQPFLTMLPAALEDPAVPEPAVTHRFRSPSGGGGTLPDWWPGNDDPLVYVTLGSVTAGEHMPFFPGVYRAVIDAVAPLPVRVLVTLGEPRDVAELGPLPPNVHVERWVPQEDVLEHASVVVGHGGHGTTVGALRHGVPLVVLPLFSTDQSANAGAVARVGAGLAVDDARPDRRLLEPPGAEAAAAVGRGVAALLGPGPARGVAERRAADLAALPPVDDWVALAEALKDAEPRPIIRGADRQGGVSAAIS